MRPRLVLSLLGFLLLAVGLLILTAIPFSLYYGESDLLPIVYSGGITALIGLALILVFRNVLEPLKAKEGFFIVTVGWVAASAFGSLPYVFSGVLPSFTDAFFETMSGYTTTGASVITNVEIVPHGILYWRAFSNWIGGMGIVVLSIALLPGLGIGGMKLFRAEVSGPTKDKLTPRLVETARLLWVLYVGVTAAEVILLMLGGMPFFDALCHSFSTIATGGFSTKNASIGYYDSVYIEVVVIIFMLVGCSNFALHYAVLKNGAKEYFRDKEFIFFVGSYLVFLAIVTLLTTWTSYNGDMAEALRDSAFSLMTVMSTTGFATADFAQWTIPAQMILLFLMLSGASAGSTGGGLKSVRVLLMLKAAFAELRRFLHPNIVQVIRYNEEPIQQPTLVAIGGFVVVYFITFSIATVLLSLTGLDAVTAMSATAAALTNEGPGLASVGPMGNFAHLSDFAKWVVSTTMLLGRLEIFTVLILFTASFWKD